MGLKHSMVCCAALSLAMPAAAQDENVHRELIRRQQQSDEFSQQLRQSVERARVPPGDAKSRQEVETRQLEQRQRLENLDQQQLERAGQTGTPPAFRPQERSRMQEERQPLLAPPAAGDPPGR
jgi:hypothetical protein